MHQPGSEVDAQAPALVDWYAGGVTGGQHGAESGEFSGVQRLGCKL